jgi:maltooligosyltrehalose trehalohydrolase
VSEPTRLGAVPSSDGATRFEVWAPAAEAVDVVLGADGRRVVALERDARTSTWLAVADGVGHGERYRFQLDGGPPLADPASGWQPDGVHGPSAVVDPTRFSWTDDGWRGVELADTVLYELHVGTFTPAGTFDAAASELARLAELGVTTVELMPVNAFPGRRNWGYDGVFPSAVQDSYGGPEGLARFVDAAHAAGLAVVLDVVYNHLGPEGSVHQRYGPYFTSTYVTPWGKGLNVSEAGSDLVRRTFVESAARWVTDYHADGLRLDAIDTIYDPTAVPFLEQLVESVHLAGRAAGRTVLTFTESAANNPMHVRPVALGGIGSDAAWNDDVHHALRVALTGDRRGYYVDYDGVADLAHALERRWVFTGRYSPYRGRTHGRPADDIDQDRFVVFTSNHDHVGNTPEGARPPFDHAGRLVAAAAVILSGYTPMLFMGEEYGETRPFPYFVDHSDPALLQSVRQGRLLEFARSDWGDTVADPADPATFAAAVLDPSVATRAGHREVAAAYAELLRVRRGEPVVHDRAATQTVTRDGDVIVVDRRLADRRSVLVLHLGEGDVTVALDEGLDVLFDAGDERWGGGGPTLSGDGAAATVRGPTAVLLTGLVTL